MYAKHKETWIKNKIQSSWWEINSWIQAVKGKFLPIEKLPKIESNFNYAEKSLGGIIVRNYFKFILKVAEFPFLTFLIG